MSPTPSTPRALRVLLVDDDTGMRRLLGSALRGQIDLELVGHATDAATAQALVEELLPDVVVMDALLRNREALPLLEAIGQHNPRTAVLILSRRDDDDLGIRALRKGAAGFLPKGTISSDALPRVVRAVARGEAVLTRLLTTRIVDRLRQIPEHGTGMRPVRSALSSREWEVLDLLCAGASTRTIAAELELSTETVRSHVKRILRKLGAHSRAEAVERARAMRTAQHSVQLVG